MVLNGSVTQAKLVNNKNFTWFDNEYKNYQPNMELVNQLKPLKEDLKVLIIAGTWCSDTQRELPRFFKIANTVGIPEKNIEIIMVNESKICCAFLIFYYIFRTFSFDFGGFICNVFIILCIYLFALKKLHYFLMF